MTQQIEYSGIQCYVVSLHTKDLRAKTYHYLHGENLCRVLCTLGANIPVRSNVKYPKVKKKKQIKETNLFSPIYSGFLLSMTHN